MPELPQDQEARQRFIQEWQSNFAVSANAGSGKTTAISHRLAGMALGAGAEHLPRTAVVTFTRKAAKQIGQRARAVLLDRITAEGRRDLQPLDQLERAFFGTIHSFCLQLAQRYGHRLGIHLNPAVVDENDDATWADFLAEDPMQFLSVPGDQLATFLRFKPLDDIFEVARRLDRQTAQRLRERAIATHVPAPNPVALQNLRDAKPKTARSAATLARNQKRVEEWIQHFAGESTYLGLPKAEGKAGGVDEIYRALFAPVKQWVADVGGILAAELSDRYRLYRLEAGIQTYADQVELALSALRDREILDRIREDGWRIILDEAQDTDPQQFAVLVEITRPVGAEPGQWPGRVGAEPPRPGHFSMVGDGQQSIYGSRADIRNFLRHLGAFQNGNGGECLDFTVTFRTPRKVIQFLNTALPDAFGDTRPHNLGLPVAEGAPAEYLQVRYQHLQPSPEAPGGEVSRLPLQVPARDPGSVGAWMAEESRQVGEWLAARGPEALGARTWGDVCLLAPRNAWLQVLKIELERCGLKVALQQKRNRSAENPVYAWAAGLAAIVVDPENGFEWFGVLRELFGLSDATLAAEIRRQGRFHWEEPEVHGPDVHAALERLQPWILSADDDGVVLRDFVEGLGNAVGVRARARALDATGSLETEWDRLLAWATELAADGAGPREWFQQLVDRLETGRPAGRSEPDAINLLTIHSAKGLEWPVVIPVGLWRAISKAPETGLIMIPDSDGRPRMYYSSSEIPDSTAESRLREHHRESVRLLYVALTRPQGHLVFPWVKGFGTNPKQGEMRFADLWGDTSLWESLHEIPVPSERPMEARSEIVDTQGPLILEQLELGSALPPMPRRVLPHQLAHSPDLVRERREASLGEFTPAPASAEEAIAYGLWWHETLEFWPWGADGEACDLHVERACTRADGAGFGERARGEIALWRKSEALASLEGEKWKRQAELGIFAPHAEGEWIDGVIDLLLHAPEENLVWVVDWKTNRRRGNEGDLEFDQRLRNEYAPQLGAYAGPLRSLFGEVEVQTFVYSTAAGRLIPIATTEQ